MKLLEDFSETDNRQFAIDYLSYETWSITPCLPRRGNYERAE